MNFLIVLSAFLAVFIKTSLALECMGCQISDLSVKCEYTYDCKKGVETCQTVVSKVNGNYSIIMSCATKDSCGLDAVFNEGFEGCQHSKTDTECYSCCYEDGCNTIESALKKLPKNIMRRLQTNEGKLSKMIDDRLDQLENEEYDDATKKSKVKNDSDEDSDEEFLGKKATTKKAKIITAADDDVSVKSGKKFTTARTNSTKISSLNGKNATNLSKTNKSDVAIIPRINIDGTQIAFKPNATNSTKLETTTERELAFHDIVNLISPNRSKSEESGKLGEHGKFSDEKGGSANLKFSVLILIASFAIGFFLPNC